MDRHFATLQQRHGRRCGARGQGQARVDVVRSRIRHAGGARGARREAEGRSRRLDVPDRRPRDASTGSRPSLASASSGRPASTEITHNLRTALDRRGRPHRARSTPATNGRRRRRSTTSATTVQPSVIESRPRPGRVHRARTAADQAAVGRRRGAALPERAAVQHRAAAGARDAANVPRRRRTQHRALPRGRALRGRRPRTARLSADS